MSANLCPINLRAVDLGTDLPGLAVLESEETDEPVTVEALREREAKRPTNEINVRRAAVDTDGHIIGMAEAFRRSSHRDGAFWIAVRVAQVYQRQGVGTALCNEIEALARQQGAEMLRLKVKEDKTPPLDHAIPYNPTFEFVQCAAIGERNNTPIFLLNKLTEGIAKLNTLLIDHLFCRARLMDGGNRGKALRCLPDEEQPLDYLRCGGKVHRCFSLDLFQDCFQRKAMRIDGLRLRPTEIAAKYIFLLRPELELVDTVMSRKRVNGIYRRHIVSHFLHSLGHFLRE